MKHLKMALALMAISNLFVGIAKAQEVGDLLPFNFSCVTPDLVLGYTQMTDNTEAEKWLNGVIAEGKCHVYDGEMQGAMLDIVVGKYKDHNNTPIDIVKVITPYGSQYIVIFHNTSKDKPTYDI